jgi:hypothetical protein
LKGCWGTIAVPYPGRAGLAQLVERQFCKLDVAGSIPAAGTIQATDQDTTRGRESGSRNGDWIDRAAPWPKTTRANASARAQPTS